MDVLFTLFSSLVPSAVTVAAVVVLVLVLKDADRPPVQMLLRAPDGGWRPLGGPGLPGVYWHVLLGQQGDPFARRFGTLCLRDGHAWFAADHPEPVREWRPEHLGPIAGCFVLRRPLFSLHRGDVDWWIGPHRLRVVVGRTRINRWIDNDLKDLASRREAHTFVSMLMANGARPGPPPVLPELR
ncbi:hypothetical protein GCM10022204_21800 [Microlunatus aurantiacus]|uniref:Uncharacterized protein n=1 Tax=Microlunatus aurantiacus TaxID=446786 RepID=A0ABP7DD41_9ACTN